jgi:hypothetical protein
MPTAEADFFRSLATVTRCAESAEIFFVKIASTVGNKLFGIDYVVNVFRKSQTRDAIHHAGAHWIAEKYMSAHYRPLLRVF